MWQKSIAMGFCVCVCNVNVLDITQGFIIYPPKKQMTNDLGPFRWIIKKARFYWTLHVVLVSLLKSPLLCQVIPSPGAGCQHGFGIFESPPCLSGFTVAGATEGIPKTTPREQNIKTDWRGCNFTSDQTKIWMWWFNVFHWGCRLYTGFGKGDGSKFPPGGRLVLIAAMEQPEGPELQRVSTTKMMKDGA